MNNTDFKEVVDGRIAKIYNVLANKSKEYSSDVDRLHNFKVAARLESTPESPEKSLWGMMKKHTVSVIDIIDGTMRGEYPTPAMRDEKLGDAINYLILLEALLIERYVDDHEKDTYEELREDLDLRAKAKIDQEI
jgi:hypothetical protein